MSEEVYYVYEHIRPSTGKVFYVGKGKDKRAYETWSRNPFWKRVVGKEGNFIVNFVVSGIDEEFAFLIEEERIDQLRKLGFVLTNMPNGGEGVSGFKPIFSDEHRTNLAKAQTGKPGKFTGEKHSPETIEKMRAKAKLRNKHTPETLAKISETKKNSPKLVCPHCGMVINTKRWHFDKCKHKQESLIIPT